MQQKDALLTKTKEAAKKVASSANNREMAAISGSEAVIKSLLAEEVDTVFGYPGGAIMPVYDVLYHHLNEINHILTRHEQGAVHAAQGYARASRKVGVVFVTSGPGATNLVTGLGGALLDSTPLVCITGQVASPLLGTDAFQETDVINVTIPVTKWNIQVTRPEDIADALSYAFYIAKSGRPGPVVVDITKDAQTGMISHFEYERCQSMKTYQPKPTLNQEQVQAAADLINQSKRPYILSGHGILLSNAIEELKTFVEKADIPVGNTLLGLSTFPRDHHNYVGFLGMHGNYACNKMMDETDLVIGIGMRFDDRVTGNISKYAPQAKFIHIDMDEAEINKNVKVDVGVLADAKEALTALTPLVKESKRPEWFKAFKDLDQEEYDKIINKDWHPVTEKLRMAEVIHRLSDKTDGQNIVVTDVGQHQMMTARYYDFKRPYSNITSGGMGTMGFGLPAAMGAAVGAPDRDVVLVAGDGGIQMTIQELGTIAANKIPVKIMILNNNFLGMVRQWQQLFFARRYSFTDISSPDYVKLGEAYGIPAVKITQRDELDVALDKMIQHQGPYIMEVVVEKEENVFPMIPSGGAVSNMLLE